jgi:hypothetical protein
MIAKNKNIISEIVISLSDVWTLEQLIDVQNRVTEKKMTLQFSVYKIYKMINIKYTLFLFVPK